MHIYINSYSVDGLGIYRLRTGVSKASIRRVLSREEAQVVHFGPPGGTGLGGPPTPLSARECQTAWATAVDFLVPQRTM